MNGNMNYMTKENTIYSLEEISSQIRELMKKNVKLNSDNNNVNIEYNKKIDIINSNLQSILDEIKVLKDAWMRNKEYVITWIH